MLCAYMKTVIFLIFIFICASVRADDDINSQHQDYETSPNKMCKVDEECWCRVFDGSEFKDEREVSKCCKEGDSSCKKVGYCVRCLYD